MSVTEKFVVQRIRTVGENSIVADINDFLTEEHARVDLADFLKYNTRPHVTYRLVKRTYTDEVIG